MKKSVNGWNLWLSLSTGLALVTIAVSCSVAYAATGSPFGTVAIPVLRGFGGVAIEDLANLETWRLATAQLVHPKQAYMLINATTLFLLGNLVERRVGPAATLLQWLVGGMATAINLLFVASPCNVGTGTSQANFAFAGSAMVLTVAGQRLGSLAWPLIALALLPGLALDIWYTGYPRPGHGAGLLLGMVSAGLLVLPSCCWLGASRHKEE